METTTLTLVCSITVKVKRNQEQIALFFTIGSHFDQLQHLTPLFSLENSHTLLDVFYSHISGTCSHLLSSFSLILALVISRQFHFTISSDGYSRVKQFSLISVRISLVALLFFFFHPYPDYPLKIFFFFGSHF